MTEAVDPETGEITEAAAADPVAEAFAAMERIVADPRYLYGNLRDSILDILKAQMKPWRQMNTAEQEAAIYGVESAARGLIVGMVDAVAAGHRPHVHGTLDQIVIKDGIKATLTIGRYEDQRHGLNDAVGGEVIVILPDVDQHMRARDRAKPDVQRELPLEDTTPGAGIPDPQPDSVTAAVVAAVEADQPAGGDTIEAAP